MAFKLAFLHLVYVCGSLSRPWLFAELRWHHCPSPILACEFGAALVFGLIVDGVKIPVFARLRIAEPERKWTTGSCARAEHDLVDAKPAFSLPQVLLISEAYRLHFCLGRVGDTSRRQNIRHVKTGDANPVVGHPVVNVVAVR